MEQRGSPQLVNVTTFISVHRLVPPKKIQIPGRNFDAHKRPGIRLVPAAEDTLGDRIIKAYFVNKIVNVVPPNVPPPLQHQQIPSDARCRDEYREKRRNYIGVIVEFQRMLEP